jgi:outer membrane protein OmpA-like peptidoglycan-associated protein
MKKQVLSFNEFIFEAYNSVSRIMEGEVSGAEELIEAISKLDKAGLSAEAKKQLGNLSGIAKAVQTTENPNAEKHLGEGLLGVLDNLTTTGVEITGIVSKVNTITYDNLIAGHVLLEDDKRVNLLDFLYLINSENCYSKINIGAFEEDGKLEWSKIQTDRRFTLAMEDYRKTAGGKRLKPGAAKFGNFIGSFFSRDPNVEKKTKDSVYLTGSGLLGNEVITGIESGVIKTEKSVSTYKDMALGGKSKKGRDKKGFSNIGGDKSVITGYNIALPLGAELTPNQKFPTKGATKVSKNPKAYFSLVLYTMGQSEKSNREIPFSDLVLIEKMRPTGETIVEYTLDMYNNDENGKPLLFAVDSSVLTAAGKDNIKAAIEQFYAIESIEILGFASQEGAVDHNTNLCKARAKAVADFVKSVKEWNIPATSVTSSDTANIQPKSPAATETERKKWRKVQFKIKGTKTITRPGEENFIEYVPTTGKFNPDKVDIYQTIITMEVSARSTRVKGR